VKQKLADHKNLDVTIVWSPMMESDNEAAARDAERMFKGTRVAQFYDPTRRVGLAFRRDVFPDAYQKVLTSLPAEHWLRTELIESGPDYSDQPEWDIYMFFDRGVKWADTPPRPFHFVRHMGRIGETQLQGWLAAHPDKQAEWELEQSLSEQLRRIEKEWMR